MDISACGEEDVPRKKNCSSLPSSELAPAKEPDPRHQCNARYQGRDGRIPMVEKVGQPQQRRTQDHRQRGFSPLKGCWWQTWTVYQR